MFTVFPLKSEFVAIRILFVLVLYYANTLSSVKSFAYHFSPVHERILWLSVTVPLKFAEKEIKMLQAQKMNVYTM